jgi:hypothetical protein
MRYTSRSAAEAYQQCPRLRYNTYHHSGVGLVPRTSSVPLVTGSAIHRGVEHLANRLRLGEEPSVETAVGLAVQQYESDVSDAGFSGNGLKTERQQWFTYQEQRALTEALIRAWAIIELPNIRARYKVLAVEREVNPIELVPGVMFQAKVDMELQEVASGDLFNYSLKSCNQWNERSESAYKADLQGITETWAVEEESKQQCEKWNTLSEITEELIEGSQFPASNLQKILAYYKSIKPVAKKLMGVRFCFLVKGVRKKPEYNSEDPNALYVTYNPLIRGYKNFTPGGINYAHSWFYPNPENKSGKGILGKGWEPFNVWESDISIKDWINGIVAGQLQPECGNVIGNHVITPTEYFRNDEDIRVGMEEVKHQEWMIDVGLKQIEEFSGSHGLEGAGLNKMFPHWRKSCEFMYGGQCSYHALCWKPEVTADPIGSGLYQIRTPHHEAEKIANGRQ